VHKEVMWETGGGKNKGKGGAGVARRLEKQAARAGPNGSSRNTFPRV
jgi:hypothetical protein